jgi:hypothetical protein
MKWIGSEKIKRIGCLQNGWRGLFIAEDHALGFDGEEQLMAGE